MKPIGADLAGRWCDGDDVTRTTVGYLPAVVYTPDLGRRLDGLAEIRVRAGDLVFTCPLVDWPGLAAAFAQMGINPSTLERV